MNINDRKAPRFNPRLYRKPVVSEQLYKEWKKKNNSTLSFVEFKNVWKLIANEIIEEIIEERDGIRLGSATGEIYIGYVPLRNPYIDRVASEQIGKMIKLQSWETGGKVGKIIYATRNKRYVFKNAPWYGFTASRPFKKRVSKAILSHPARYKNSIEKR